MIAPTLATSSAALLKDQHVLVLGLGLSGLAMARWCARCGARVTVADTRSAPPQLTALQRELPSAHFVSGAFDASLLADTDIRVVCKSPGLTPLEVATISGAAHALGIRLTGELGLFSQALAGLQAERGYQPRVLAVTGTNGKTTVTALTGQLVSRAGKTVAVAGNIGPTLLDTLADRLAQDTLPEVWVLELSSFQLDAVQGFEPTAATVLNITQDHLDWHGAVPAYLQAKANVFGQHSLRLLNRNDPLVLAMRATDAPVPAVKSRQRHSAPRPFVTFGADLPQRPGDFGMEQVNGMVWLVRALAPDDTGKKRKRSDAAPPQGTSTPLGAGPDEAALQLQRLMPADALRIRGRHNAVNALAALALASAAGCSLAPMLYGLREYRGEPHRLESIGIFNEVEYFDDSKGTNVGATVAALHGLGLERKLLVILGGDGKGQDFAPLADPVSRYARAVLLIGRDAPLLRAALAGTGVPLIEVASMTEAVAQASAIAQGGDAVLLSPACASFDMFDNYQQRAQVFVAALRDCAHAAGVELEGAL